MISPGLRELAEANARVCPSQVSPEALCRGDRCAGEQVAIAVGHVRRGVPDGVANLLKREAGIVHHRDEEVSEFVKDDGLKELRLPTLDRRTRRLLRVRTLPRG